MADFLRVLLVAGAVLAALAVPVIAEDVTGVPFTCDAEYREPTVDASGLLDLMCTSDETGGAFRIRWDRVRGISDLTCSVAFDSEGSLLLDISNEPYDFQVTPKGVTVLGSTRFVVVPLSRPFGSIVIDARVDCADGSFYRPDAEVDFINTKDSTGPLDAGELGEVYYDARHCNGAWSTITLTPRFPEWRCSGCEAYEPERAE